MFTPVLLFAFAGVVVGLGTLFTTQAIFGDLAAPTSTWHLCWNVVLQGGWTVFNQLPLLFAVSLPIGLAKKQNARCCMEALVGYLTFHYFVSTLLSQWGGSFGVDFSAEVGSTSGLAMIASIKTLDMGMVGALAISGVIIAVHNRFFDTELPDWLGVFNGSVFVYVVSFFVLLPIAVLCCFVWPHVQDGISALQGFLTSTGLVGVWVFTFLERILIPFGLHHLVYSPRSTTALLSMVVSMPHGRRPFPSLPLRMPRLIPWRPGLRLPASAGPRSLAAAVSHSPFTRRLSPSAARSF